ncbi:hypothetical protein C8R43DRAFT_940858 [Mycena crocata]|nr:hypothetical protein C8R43DRAFT_940858 [Mycena crocata]
MDDVEFFFVDEPPLEPDDSENHLGNVRRVVACLLKDLREFGGLAAMAIKTGHDRRHDGKMEKWGRDREAERAQQRGAAGRSKAEFELEGSENSEGGGTKTSELSGQRKSWKSGGIRNWFKAQYGAALK